MRDYQTREWICCKDQVQSKRESIEFLRQSLAFVVGENRWTGRMQDEKGTTRLDRRVSLQSAWWTDRRVTVLMSVFIEVPPTSVKPTFGTAIKNPRANRLYFCSSTTWTSFLLLLSPFDHPLRKSSFIVSQSQFCLCSFNYHFWQI